MTLLHSTRFKLIASLVGVSLLIVVVSLLVGGNLIYRSLLREAHDHVRQDLNVARLFYRDRVEAIRLSLEVTGLSSDLREAIRQQRTGALAGYMEALSRHVTLDFGGIANARGEVLHRLGPNPQVAAATNPAVARCLQQGRGVAGSVVLDERALRIENPGLVERILPPRAAAGTDATAAAGLALVAAVPVWDGTRLLGALYGGVLLNGDQQLVDQIRDTVFEDQRYQGRPVGTVTIFQQDRRVATNVLDPAGERAVGTLAAANVAAHVLGSGGRWTDRARVLDDWYITAYEPISDIHGRRVGMLYVGTLEARYAQVRHRAVSAFVWISLAGMGFALLLGWVQTSRTMRPVSALIRASGEISKGNFTPDIGPVSKDDIGTLQRRFQEMTSALRERDRRQREESELRLMQSEKQASVGRLAAGVAHEVNNPLTAVLSFTHLILRRTDLPQEVYSDLETIAEQTKRVRTIVKDLLDFSRQTELNLCPVDAAELVSSGVKLFENQALVKGVTLRLEAEPDLPVVTVDQNQLQSVLVNMMLNALDATDAGGEIVVRAQRRSGDGRSGLEIAVADTGSGIAPEHVEKIFEPFFTTKEVGEGTGLGLAVSAGIIARHGGTIGVTSQLARGSTFRLWIPL